MNAQGFCHKHFDNLFNMKNKLALALILESHLDEVRQKLDIKGSGGKKAIVRRKKAGAGGCCRQLRQPVKGLLCLL
jgi:hypothetical protein